MSHPGPRRDGSGFRAGRARRRKEWIMAGEGNWYDLRVYVGNIGRYNEGSLVGGWATLPMGRDDLDAFLRDRVGIDGERYEEYRIDDFDLPDWLPAGPGERVVDERTSLEDLNVMAGVLSTLDEDDAAKARIWIEEGMSPAGRLSPLVFANVALQADDIPFYAYEAGTRFDPGISSNEEAFALTAPRTIRNLPRRWTDGSAHTWTWRRSAVTSPRTARCMTTAIWTVPWIRASTGAVFARRAGVPRGVGRR